MGFGVWDSRFGVWVFRMQGLGFRVWGLGLGTFGLRIKEVVGILSTIMETTTMTSHSALRTIFVVGGVKGGGRGVFPEARFTTRTQPWEYFANVVVLQQNMRSLALRQSCFRMVK